MKKSRWGVEEWLRALFINNQTPDGRPVAEITCREVGTITTFLFNHEKETGEYAGSKLLPEEVAGEFIRFELGRDNVVFKIRNLSGAKGKAYVCVAQNLLDEVLAEAAVAKQNRRYWEAVVGVMSGMPEHEPWSAEPTLPCGC